MGRWRLEGANYWLGDVHDPKDCTEDRCPLHKRSEHHLRGFPQRWRGDRRIIERVNPFGGACPDPDSPLPEGSPEWVHGCIMNPCTGTPMCSPWQIDGVDAAWATDTVAVTKDARVWSFRPLTADGKVDRSVAADYTSAPVLMPNIDRKGQKFVELPPFLLKVQVRKVVLTGWRGPRPSGHRPAHLDGDPANLSLSNLDWVVMRSDATLGHRRDRLTLERVKQVRTLYAEGRSLGQILSDLDLQCSEESMINAITGERWGWVEDPPRMRLRPGDRSFPPRRATAPTVTGP